MGDFDKAIKYHMQHLAIAKEVGDLTGEGRAYGNLRIAYPWQRQCGASSAGSGWSSGGVGGSQVFRRLLACAETEPRVIAWNARGGPVVKLCSPYRLFFLGSAEWIPAFF